MRRTGCAAAWRSRPLAVWAYFGLAILRIAAQPYSVGEVLFENGSAAANSTSMTSSSTTTTQTLTQTSATRTGTTQTTSTTTTTTETRSSTTETRSSTTETNTTTTISTTVSLSTTVTNTTTTSTRTFTTTTRSVTTTTGSTSSTSTTTRTITSTTSTTLTKTVTTVTITSITSTTTVTTTSTTKTSTTMTSTRTTSTFSTTTTLLPMSLWVTPPARLMPCEPMRLTLEPPPGGWAYGWRCEPKAAPLCIRVLKQAEVQGYQHSILEVSRGEVAGAGFDTVNLGLEEFQYITLEGFAFALNGVTYALAKQEIFFNAGGQSLREVPGPRTFSVLDEYVRVGATMESCGGAPLKMKWAWRPVDGDWVVFMGVPNYPRLRVPSALFPGAGDYNIRGSLEDESSKVEIVFDVTLTGVPPPDVVLTGPAKAASACEVVLDASATRDFSGESLEFVWSCLAIDSDSEDAAACEALAERSTNATLRLPGGSLAAGLYEFGVTVFRTDANSSATLDLEILGGTGDTLPPVVIMSPPPPRISPQLPFAFSASTVSSDSCRLPPHQAWWMIGPLADDTSSGDNATLLLMRSSGEALAVSVAAPLLVQPGTYRLRLILSDAADVAWDRSDGISAFAFDSTAFIVSAAPKDGTCLVYPRTGNATTTPFRLGSHDWEDEDVPLMHRFSWRRGHVNDLDESSLWTRLSPWQVDTDFRNVIFGSTGNITVRAEARDSLGSVSAAYGSAVIVKPQRPPETYQMLDVLDLAYASGDPFIMLSSATAMADTIDEHEERGGSELPLALLDVVQGSGVLNDPTIDSLGASTSVVLAVLGTSRVMHSVSDGQGVYAAAEKPKVAYEVAMKSVALVSEIAAASSELGGVDAEVPKALVLAVGTMLMTVAEQAGRGDEQPGGLAMPLSPEQLIARQRSVSSGLQRATGAIATAAVKAAGPGEVVTIDAGLGPKIIAQELNTKELSRESRSFGEFSLPQLLADEGSMTSSRRLSPVCGAGKSGGDAPVILVETRWPLNIFGYAGVLGEAADMPRPVLPTSYQARHGVEAMVSIESACCDVNQELVTGIELRMCGKVLDMSNLPDLVRFDVPLPASDGPFDEGVFETRVCQHFNRSTQTWSDEGCMVESIEQDRVRCACNHLSSFSAGHGQYFVSFHEVITCNRVDVWSPRGIDQFSSGSWQQRPVPVCLIMTLAGLLIFSFWSMYRDRRWHADTCGVSRTQFLTALNAQEPSDTLENGSLQRILDAAFNHGKPALYAKVVSLIQTRLFGLPFGPLEDCLMRNLRGGLAVSFGVVAIQAVAADDMGLTRRDLWTLGKCKRALMLLSIEAFEKGANSTRGSLSSAASLSSGDISVDDVVADYTDHLGVIRSKLLQGDHLLKRLSIWNSFKMHHPVLQLARATFRTRRSVDLTCFLVRICTAFAIIAFMLLSGAATWSVESAAECVEGAFVDYIGEDATAAAVGWVASMPLAWGIGRIHSRRFRFHKAKSNRAAEIVKRRSEDRILVVWGAMIMVISVSLTLLVLANVSETDSAHWLCAAFAFFFISWALVPLIWAVTWNAMIKVIMRRPHWKSSMGSVVEKLAESNVSKNLVYSYDKEGRPILKPQWLQLMKQSRKQGHDERRGCFQAWAENHVVNYGEPAATSGHGLDAARRAQALPPPAPPALRDDVGEVDNAVEACEVTGSLAGADRVGIAAMLVPPVEDGARLEVHDQEVRVEATPGFVGWVDEWAELHRDLAVEAPPEAPVFGALHTSVFQVSNLANPTFEQRQKKRGLTHKGRVLDGRRPPAMCQGEQRQPEDWPWTSQWQPPEGPLSPPSLSSWGSLGR